MNDMSATIIAKSDQLGADDLIGRTMTIKIISVEMTGEEQPVAVRFEGDAGKPYFPCKSMRRVMVHVWGRDANAYTGRSMTLYRDAKVKFGALEVGGVRISHMSHMDQDTTMALTATKGAKKAYKVLKLRVEAVAASTAELPRLTQRQFLDGLEQRLIDCKTRAAVDAIVTGEDVLRALKAFENGNLARLNSLIATAIAQHPDDPDAWQGGDAGGGDV